MYFSIASSRRLCAIARTDASLFPDANPSSPGRTSGAYMSVPRVLSPNPLMHATAQT